MAADRDAASLAELTIPQKVVVNDETYLPEWKIVAGLSALYRDGERIAVARLCDDFLDPSGRLLGLVREQATA